MIKNVKTNSFYKIYLNVTSSIAFIPTLISLGLFFLSLFTLSLDQASPERLAGYEITIKNIINPNSARSLLGAIVSGMITLMVFSFSMVMVVLSQMASNYSPRVLPSLVGRRFHQVVMGFYLGTIVYTFVVLSSIQSKAYAFEIPSLSIIINAGLSLICLGLFMSFIQSISENIQIGNIINNIYLETFHSIEKKTRKEVFIPAHQVPDTENWVPVRSPVSGYWDSIELMTFMRKARNMNITLHMLVSLGKYINRQDIFFLVNRALSREEQEDIFQTFILRHQEIVSQNYLYGFKQLTEIALKALSPGVNDPGTALQAMDRLTDLFIISTEMPGFCIKTDSENKLRLIYQPVFLEEIFYFSFGSIRNCAGNSISVLHKLMMMIKALSQNDRERNLTGMLLTALNDTIEQFTPDIRSQTDKKRLARLAEEIISLSPDHPESIKAQSNLKCFLENDGD